MSGKGLRLNRLIGRGLEGGSARDTMKKDHLQKQIGTTFVVLKALREGFLVLRYPSGTSVARKLPISQAVVGIVDDVITDQKFEVAKYSQLTNDDKKVVYDLFKITRYDQMLRNPLMNPYELDEAQKYLLELDKPKGNSSWVTNATSPSFVVSQHIVKNVATPFVGEDVANAGRSLVQSLTGKGIKHVKGSAEAKAHMASLRAKRKGSMRAGSFRHS
ncbi:hypothetical protein DYB37_013896 [Aphanomyces astaci]|uniref:Uncharacterized protein n=2 Tax=Aphanomyces astaci TaxID=112090 RepID=A0A3R7WJY0_APHAT|nr:hypothetical protein DYB35_013911 [Aphanomyces astaci]RHZ27142.1 hypothetical protein DYB37_013896 [Aphanomyces astaci]RQM27631.1 hypothetical protein B5M09_006801 [Aphanomyces astaci]